MGTIINKRSLYGFSLIEVVIFIAILSIFFVTAMAVVTISLQSMKSNENKIRATQYAEELMEWIKAQKEIDWQLFISRAGANNSYCFNSSINTWPSIGDCINNDYSLPIDYNSTIRLFRRNVELIPDVPAPITTSVQVNINVQWKEPGGSKNVNLNSVLTLWE